MTSLDLSIQGKAVTPSGSSHEATTAPRSQLALAWPPFLDLLQSDLAAAIEGFYRFAMEMFRLQPPQRLRLVPSADREDALHDVVYHCCKDECRVLRTYRSRGTPFASWLRQVADRRILAGLRTHNGVKLEPLEEASRIPDRTLESDHCRVVSLQEVIDLTLKCLERLDEESQLLIIASASGLTPLETAALLGLPKGHNRRLSDKCRYARTRLARMLKNEGVDLDSLFPTRRSNRVLRRRGAEVTP